MIDPARFEAGFFMAISESKMWFIHNYTNAR